MTCCVFTDMSVTALLHVSNSVNIIRHVFELFLRSIDCYYGGSVAKWLACWTQAQKGLG